MILRILGVLTVCVCGVAGDVIHVPADQPTIGEALSVAVDGDEIVVASGIYNVPSGLIIGVSDLTIRGATGDPSDTVLDGGGVASVFAASNETGLVFEALTLRNCGTAVSLTQCLAEIRSCAFVDNAASGFGAVRLVGSSTTIRDSSFEGTRVPGSLTGGAIAAFGGSLTVTGCRFVDNRVEAGPGVLGAFGGSILLGTFNPGVVQGVDCDVEDSVFIGNASQFGAGVSSVGGRVRIDRCRFTRNSGTYGGAVLIRGIASGSGGTLGGGRVTNSVFDGNTAVRVQTTFGNVNGIGGAIGVTSDTGSFGEVVELVNNTFHANSAEASGEAVYADGVSPSVVLANNIFASHAGVDFAPTGSFSAVNNASAAAAVIGFVDVVGEDGLPGTGDENFALEAGSLAIDAGDNTRVPPGVDRDFVGSARFVDDGGTADTGVGPGAVVDLGAYEFQPGNCGIADIAPPTGTLDIDDVLTFLAAFGSGSPAADVASPSGVLDIDDVLTFLNAFAGGC